MQRLHASPSAAETPSVGAMRILVWDVRAERASSWLFWRREWWARLGLGVQLLALAIAALLVTGLVVSLALAVI